MHTVRDITQYLETFAPLSSQESYDNSGLITGNFNNKVSGVLLSLDCTEAVIAEAISKGANLVISHHPIVFKGLKSLTGKNYVERTIIKAIKNDISIYAIHTNLDNYVHGVNFEIGKRLGLKNLKILAPVKRKLNKISFFVPENYKEQVKTAMFEAGAGNIGNYSECAFESEGKGQFKPGQSSNPFEGEKEKLHSSSELKIEILVSVHNTNNVIAAMQKAHPYEEVAYDVYQLENFNQTDGAGMIGELEVPVETNEFLFKVKETFKTGAIKHTKTTKKEIKKVAFCGGSGSFLIENAKKSKADIYITGDLKYHEFFDADEQIILEDIGHFESEQFTPNLLNAILKKKFTKFAVHLSNVDTNPINYI